MHCLFKKLIANGQWLMANPDSIRANSKKLKAKKGFTLVELLVAISIIAVLSATGTTVYTNARNQALKAKRMADIDSIKKAYEKNFSAEANNGQGGYKPITTADFASGSIPSPDNTSSTSYLVIGPSTGALKDNTSSGAGVNFAACVNTVTGARCAAPSSTCYCATSNQGEKLTTDTNSTCDSFGVLQNGLIAYWKLDESSWNGIAGEVLDFKNQFPGRAVNGANTGVGQAGFGRAGSFDGVNNGANDYVSIPNNINFGTNLTISTWFKTNKNGAIFATSSPGADYVSLVINYSKLNGLTDATGDWPSYDIASASNVVDNLWHHGVFVINGSTLNLYVDNRAETPVTVSASSVSSFNRSSFIGYSGMSWSTNYFDGLIDDLRVYNRSLSAPEVSLLYNNGKGCFP